jgi:hypothetical protein
MQEKRDKSAPPEDGRETAPKAASQKAQKTANDKAAREARLAEALRTNLRRRKGQGPDAKKSKED